MRELTEAERRPAGARPMPIVLCIDDDPAVSRAIQLRLSPYAVEVQRAFHGMQGFALATRDKPEVIITDLQMPMGPGEEVLQTLKRNAQTAHIPVIVLTGLRGEDLPGRLQHQGAVAFFRKPIPFEELLQELARHIPLRKREPEEALHAASP